MLLTGLAALLFHYLSLGSGIGAHHLGAPGTSLIFLVRIVLTYSVYMYNYSESAYL